MLERAKTLQPMLTDLRRTIHKNPELSFEEHETAALVAKTLDSFGIKHKTGIGKTGVVASIGNGNGPKIGVRADMDALPITEMTGVDYASVNEGKMHACGHDSHTTMLMGVAKLLSEENFDGEVRLLFQPSEENSDSEGKSGATRMIEDGAIKDLDAVIALHVDPSLESGKVGIKDGYLLANADTIFAKIKGKGGHGAAPHMSRDPIFMTAPILTAIHGIASRWVNPTEPAVITVGRLSGGTVSNVIPNDVELDLTLRSISDDVRKQIVEEVENALSISKALGGDYEIDVRWGYPALYNDPNVAGWLRSTSEDLLSANNVIEGQLVMGGEDFAYMAKASQGAMLRLGTWKEGTPQRFLHHPEFDLDESTMPIGTAVLAETALRFVRGTFS